MKLKNPSYSLAIVASVATFFSWYMVFVVFMFLAIYFAEYFLDRTVEKKYKAEEAVVERLASDLEHVKSLLNLMGGKTGDRNWR